MESYNFEKNIFPTTSKKIVYKKDPNNNNNESSIIISPPLSPKKYSSKKKDRYNNIDDDDGIIVNSTNKTIQKPSTAFNNIQDVYSYLASCDKPRYRMKWYEIPNELREFIETNKKITSINHSSRTLPLPVLSTESSPINTTTESANANVIYVHNVAAGSSSSPSSQKYDGRHAYTSSFSSPPPPPPSSSSSISPTTTTTSPSFDVMRIDIINNNNIISNNKKESSHGHHRHQPYSTKPFKSNDKTFSYKRSNIKGKERGIYDDNRFNTYMSSINTTPTLGQSSGTCSSDSTPPISPKNCNNKSLSNIITKKQQRKKSSSSSNSNNNNNNIRRSSDVNAISINRQYGVIKSNSASSTIAERKRKSNSLARVMADRGLFEESIIPIISSTTNSGEVKSIRIPPSPPLEYEKLIENLNNMNLKNGILNTAEPNITWKGQSLSITHLPHYDALHPKEAFVASALRLTPVQYLTAKHTLVSAAQRYSQRNFPFKKSDAQKLLRIDVNKASKLWEFFRQVEWI